MDIETKLKACQHCMVRIVGKHVEAYGFLNRPGTTLWSIRVEQQYCENDSAFVLITFAPTDVVEIVGNTVVLKD